MYTERDKRVCFPCLYQESIVYHVHILNILNLLPHFFLVDLITLLNMIILEMVSYVQKHIIIAPNEHTMHTTAS